MSTNPLISRRPGCDRLVTLSALFLLSLVSIHGAQGQEQQTLMTKGRLAADLGNYAAAIEAFGSVAADDSVAPSLRAEALVRLGLARSRAGDTRGSLEAFRTVMTRYAMDRATARFAIGALASGVPGKVWTDFRPELEEVLRTADVISVSFTGMPQSSPKIVRLKWDDFEVRGTWKSIGGGRVAVTRSYQAEVAAYELDKMLGLDMIPPTIERTIEGQPGAITFWVNGVRIYRDAQEMPKTPHWSHQTARMKLYDSLIDNRGRNLANMIVDRNDNLLLVDHELAFSTERTIKDPPSLFDRQLVEKLKALHTPALRLQLKSILRDDEIESLLARRDALLAHLEKLIAERGEAAVVF